MAVKIHCLIFFGHTPMNMIILPHTVGTTVFTTVFDDVVEFISEVYDGSFKQ